MTWRANAILPSVPAHAMFALPARCDPKMDRAGAQFRNLKATAKAGGLKTAATTSSRGRSYAGGLGSLRSSTKCGLCPSIPPSGISR
jgi:hypothetical protein